MKTSLADDPAVIGMSIDLGLESDLVVGKLHRLWSWANLHTSDGNAVGVTPEWVDEFLHVEGFAKSMEKFKWLKIKDDRVTVPRFDRHNGQSAKTRANARKRQERHRKRNGKVSRSKRDSSVTREEKRREEKKNKTTPPLTPPPARADLPPHVALPPCPVAWGGVVSEMIELGVFAPHPAVDAAQAAGASPEQVLAVLEYARTIPDAYGPGAIRNRVLICRPGLDPGEGWPEPSPEYTRQRQADSEGEKRKRQQAEQAREDARRAEAKRAAVQQEQTWGPVLDQLKPDELDQLADSVLGQTGPAVTHYRRRGATGMVRGLLLAAMAGHGYEGAEA